MSISKMAFKSKPYSLIKKNSPSKLYQQTSQWIIFSAFAVNTNADKFIQWIKPTNAYQSLRDQLNSIHSKRPSSPSQANLISRKLYIISKTSTLSCRIKIENTQSFLILLKSQIIGKKSQEPKQCYISLPAYRKVMCLWATNRLVKSTMWPRRCTST